MPKKHLASKIFLFLVTAAAIFISISGFLTSGGQNIIFQLLFLPVTLYLIYASFAVIKYLNLEVVLSERKGGIFFYLVIFFALAVIAVSNVTGFGQKEAQPASEEKTATFTPLPIPTTPAEKMLTIKTESAKTKINIRETPSTSSKVIGKTLQGEQFVLVQKEGDWYKVKFKDSFGYLYKDYVAIPKE